MRSKPRDPSRPPTMVVGRHPHLLTSSDDTGPSISNTSLLCMYTPKDNFKHAKRYHAHCSKPTKASEYRCLELKLPIPDLPLQCTSSKSIYSSSTFLIYFFLILCLIINLIYFILIYLFLINTFLIFIILI